MKKITLLLFLLCFYSHFGQVCQQTFSVTGPDTSTVLTVESSELWCYGGTVNSITISAAHLDADGSDQCGWWYTFLLDIDGTTSTVCAPDLVGMTITDFTTLTITSSDADDWTDTVLMSVTFEVDFTADALPNCDAVLTSPADLAENVSADGMLMWNAASGGAAGYKVTVGTTSGGVDILNAFDVGNVMSYNIPGVLLPDMTYYVSIKSYNSFGDATGCQESSFTTCGAATDFFEDFSTVPDEELPACWSTIVETDSMYAFATVYEGMANLYNSGAGPDAEIMLISPMLTDLPLGTHRVKFKAAGWTGYVLEVGTLSDPADSSTFTLVSSIILGEDMMVYNVSFNEPTTDLYMAFRHGVDDIYQSIAIDDIIWEPIPTEAPECVGDLAVTVDESCGNFMTQFSWSDVPQADGYTVSIGSAPGLTDIVDNLDLGFVASYEFTGTFATTYYYTLVPYNASGPAVGCTEDLFETAPDGCYCTSVPIEFDGDGITNVQLGSTDLPVPAAAYYDGTGEGAVDIGQGLNANVQITFNTGYTYDSNVWVDFNDNYVFEEDELMASGESTDNEPTTLNVSFVMPEDAILGEHRMRIGTSDEGQVPPDPCFSGYWGVTVDFLVNIVVPTCSPPEAVASISADCENNQYYVNVDVTDLGDGNPFITNGDDINIDVTATGSFQVGPFENGTSVSLTIQHGVDMVCDMPLGMFNYVCPPSNDECSSAIELIVNEDFSCTEVTAGTTVGSTGSEPFDEITGWADDDVWFSFVATNSAHRISLIDIEPIEEFGSTDMGMAVYNGADGCGSLVFVDDSDPNTLDIQGLTPDAIYYVRVYGWYDDGSRNTFNICIGTPGPAPDNDEFVNAMPLVMDEAICDGVTNNGSNDGATNSGVGLADCFNYGANDVWFSFVTPSNIMTVDISTDFTGGTLVDTEIALYDLDGDTLVELACDQDSGNTILSNGFSYNSLILDTPVDPEHQYYVRVSGYGSFDTGSFCLEVSTNQLSTTDVDMKKFVSYPNPVRSLYSIEYEGRIESVHVMSLVGQQVLSQTVSGSVAHIDMSSLAAGTYIVKVNSADVVKTLKVIKE